MKIQSIIWSVTLIIIGLIICHYIIRSFVYNKKCLALPQMPRFVSLDLSCNAIPFFCADSLVRSLKEIESTPKSNNQPIKAIDSPNGELYSDE